MPASREPDDADRADALAPTETIANIILKGRYVLGPELGRGGFGITYLATDADVGSRKVVVKVLNEHRSRDAGNLNKFRREMEALSRIDHPNVVGVIDYWEAEDERQYLVMQFVPGGTLRRLIRRDGLPLPVIADIVKQMGRALAAAHDAGVIHRDIKPDNIMVRTSPDGEHQVKLIDFGVSAIRAQNVHPLSTDICGTFTYMAPEQFEGKSSAASDIYQMGIVAYEMITGTVPFRAAAPVGIVLEQREGLRAMPRQLRPDLPEAAEEALLKALSLDPLSRFRSAKDFGDALADPLDPGLPPVPAKLWRTRGEAWQAPKRRPTLLHLIAGAAVLAVLAALAALAVWGGPLWRPKSPVTEFVAVLPFENRTGNPDLAYLAEGITESLIADLSRIPTLRVSALGSVLKYEGRQVDARIAGRELGAARVIGGSISRRAGGLFVDTELIDVRTGARTWGNAYSADLSSISDVLQRFSSEVTDQLRLKLSGPLRDRLKRQYAVGSRSYEQYLNARFHLNKRTATDFDLAIRYFEEVVAADPEYAPARAGLADTYAKMAFFGPFASGAEPRDALERARVAARRAMQLDGTLAEAYSSLALVEMAADYDWGAAERDYLRSIELDPNFGATHEDYALELAALGRTGDAVREIILAEKLEPDNSHFRAAHGLIFYLGRRYDESLAVYSDIARTPEGAARVADVVATDYWMKSMPAEAEKVLDWMPKEVPETLVPFTITAYCRMGQMDQARAEHDKYYLHGGRSWWYYLAMAHLSMHRPDDAIRDLERAYEERWGEAIWIGADPMFDALHSNPGFRRLLVSLNLASKL
jgi:TolB-like protein/tRNA A-37 threonylcarbamoyl transferase component Bud32